jgi:hypothetical protein
MKLEYKDRFTNEYRYGKLSPKGITFGTDIHNRLKTDNNWKLKNTERHIEEKNDNRSDRDFGFTDSYIHKKTNKNISVHCAKSATGKTLYWTFVSNDIRDKEELEQLLIDIKAQPSKIDLLKDLLQEKLSKQQTIDITILELAFRIYNKVGALRKLPNTSNEFNLALSKLDVSYNDFSLAVTALNQGVKAVTQESIDQL